MREQLRSAIEALIRKASTSMPPDVEDAIRLGLSRETAEGSKAVLETVMENIHAAREGRSPVCQDTGFPTFWFRFPEGTSIRMLKEITLEALAKVTGEGLMRPNAVDPVTGRNSGTNIGDSFPAFYFEEHDEPTITVRLLLKGGGSENMSSQYRLPDPGLKAGRDLEGVRKVVLDAVHKAQGFGCSPGIIAVGIGGDRAGSLVLAKRQLLRILGTTNPDPMLADLEDRLFDQLNQLGIGAMGFGGDTTVLGVRIGKAHRHPACFFVSIAYGCWALRRGLLVFDPANPDNPFISQED